MEVHAATVSPGQTCRAALLDGGEDGASDGETTRPTEGKQVRVSRNTIQQHPKGAATHPHELMGPTPQPELPTWARRTLPVRLPFKLQYASPEGARHLARGPMKHHSVAEQPAALVVNSVLQVDGTIDSQKVQFLHNSRAAVLLIQHDKLSQSSLCLMEGATMSTVGANRLPMDVVGQVSLPVCLCGIEVHQMFLVVEQLIVEALLWADFLDKNKAVLDFAHHRLTLGTQSASTIVDLQQQASFQVFTVAVATMWTF